MNPIYLRVCVQAARTPVRGQVGSNHEPTDWQTSCTAAAALDEEVFVDPRFAGLNATAQIIDVAVRPTGEKWTTDFADDCIAQTATKLTTIQPKLVVMEGAGTFELPVAGIFATVGLPFAIVNPRSIREFARAAGLTYRGGYTQAGLLAHFGELVHPEPRPLAEDVITKLKEIRARRDEVLQMLQLERSRSASASAILRKDLQRHIDFLEKSSDELAQEFNRTVRLSAAWR
jgi:transposase